MDDNITIVTLMAGRFYTLAPYFWGLSILEYPKEKIDLVCMTNSDNEDFINAAKARLDMLKGYRSKSFIETDIVSPSTNAFIDRGTHTQEHAETIAKLYNEVYKNIKTEYFMFLEDDVIAPSNTVLGLMSCFTNDTIGYVCGTQMCRHNNGLFVWDLGYKRVYPDGDVNNEKTYYGKELRKPWGKREIGLGHFGLTMLRKSICDKIHKPIFKPISTMPGDGSLPGCDMVLCLELNKLGYKRICNFDVRGLHMDSQGKIH